MKQPAPPQQANRRDVQVFALNYINLLLNTIVSAVNYGYKASGFQGTKSFRRLQTPNLKLTTTLI